MSKVQPSLAVSVVFKATGVTKVKGSDPAEFKQWSGDSAIKNLPGGSFFELRLKAIFDWSNGQFIGQETEPAEWDLLT